MLMRDHDKASHSILIVSCSEQFNASVKRELPVYGFAASDICKNAACARQQFFERYYDIVVINFPLPDETGAELVFDIAEKSNVGILLAVPSEIFSEVAERVVDSGVMVISKPIQSGQITYAVRLLSAIQDRIHSLEQDNERAHEKMEELRLVSKAKLMLIINKQMSEDEAHRYIGREAMNHGLSRKRVAERIIEKLE